MCTNMRYFSLFFIEKLFLHTLHLKGFSPHVCTNVIVNVTIIRKHFATSVTSKMLFTCMCKNVTLQVSFLWKSIPTNITFKLTFSCVHKLMNCEMSSPSQNLPAHITFERLLPSMCIHVELLQVFTLQKGSVTWITFESSYLSVCKNVILYMCTMWK